MEDNFRVFHWGFAGVARDLRWGAVGGGQISWIYTWERAQISKTQRETRHTAE